MRHTGAGLAIPDFPWSFGRVIPPVWTVAIGVHYTHRIGAVVVSGIVIAMLGHILAHHRGKQELTRPALLLSATVLAPAPPRAPPPPSRRRRAGTRFCSVKASREA